MVLVTGVIILSPRSRDFVYGANVSGLEPSVADHWPGLTKDHTFTSSRHFKTTPTPPQGRGIICSLDAIYMSDLRNNLKYERVLRF